jgi:hypothetical protein
MATREKSGGETQPAAGEQAASATNGERPNEPEGWWNDPETSIHQMNVWQRIARLKAELGPVRLDGEFREKAKNNEEQGKLRFRFTSHSHLMDHVRQRMGQLGIVIVPEMKGISEEVVEGEYRNTTRVKATLHFTVVDAFSGTSFGPYEWIGEGSDYGDKAVNKAGTIGHKFWLLKFLELSAGDKDFDPDASNPLEEAGGRRRATQDARRPDASSAPPTSSAERDKTAADLLALGKLVGADGGGNQKKGAPRWFEGKVAATILHNSGERSKSTYARLSPEGWAKGTKATLAEIAKEHEQWCGESCEHFKAAEAPVDERAETEEAAKEPLEVEQKSGGDGPKMDAEAADTGYPG